MRGSPKREKGKESKKHAKEKRGHFRSRARAFQKEKGRQMAKRINKHGTAVKRKNIRKSLKNEEVFMAELNDERGRELIWKKLPTDQGGYPEDFLDKESNSNQRKEVKKHGKRHL